MSLVKKAVAEFIGTAALLAVVVGSGIMGERLAGGNEAIALLANALATGAGLTFIILAFINISGAHINPAVSLAELISGNLSAKEFATYLPVQIFGGLVGVGLANVMFELPVFFASTKTRTGAAQWLAEFLATFGLIGVIYCGAKFYPRLIAPMVACYITAAYWFTSSTSFANPAVTIARAFSDTFTGIRPIDVLPFVAAQILGTFAAVFLFNWLLREEESPGAAALEQTEPTTDA